MYSDQDNSYHSHYSEENIYKLAFKYKNQIFDHDGHYESFVVFISNDNKHVPLWKQRVSPNPDNPVLWDYHVIFVIRSEDELNVIDLDSTLGYRVPFDKYVKETFKPEFPLTNKDFKHMFRVVPADDFLDYFVSDRSHMIDQTKAGAGNAELKSYPHVYKQPPPPWPTIIGFKAECETNAEKYINMHITEADRILNRYGKVMNIDEFMRMGRTTTTNTEVKKLETKTSELSMKDVPLTA